MKFTFKDIQEGTYTARVSEIKNNEGPFGPFLRLIFTIVDGELKNYRFSGIVKPTDLKQSKFYKWVTNILGERPDDCFDTKDLIGKHCRVMLSKSKNFYAVTDVHMKSHGILDPDTDLDSITVMLNKAKS